MANDLHHASIFVTDMDRALHLFKDILGFELLWRVSPVGGRKLSALLGIPDMKAELAYLQGRSGGVGVELVRLIRPTMDESPIRFGKAGMLGLSLVVEDLNGLHQRLTEEGWTPFTPCMQIRTPQGDPVRVFCFRTEEGLTLELIEEVASSAQEDRTT